MGLEAISVHDNVSHEIDKGAGSLRQKSCLSDEFAARLLMARLQTDSKDRLSPAQWARPQQANSTEALHWSHAQPIAMQVQMIVGVLSVD